MSASRLSSLWGHPGKIYRNSNTASSAIRVEVVFAVYKTGKPPLNHVEKWVKRGKGRVSRFHDELPLRAVDAVICRGASIGQSAGPSLRARTGDRLPRPRCWH